MTLMILRAWPIERATYVTRYPECFYASFQAVSDHSCASFDERPELTKTNEDLTLEIARHKGTEDELRAIIDNAPVFLWSDLPDGYCDFLNQRWLTYFNLSLQEAQGAGWATVLHPDDEDAQEAIRQKRDYAVEFRIVLPDGTVKYLESISRHLFSERGELVEVVRYRQLASKTARDGLTE